jgi:hypothetical protein
MELRADHPIVALIARGVHSECVNDPTPGLDCEQFTLTTWEASGEYSATIYQPYVRTDDIGPWVRLIDNVRECGALVPREFAAV